LRLVPRQRAQDQVLFVGEDTLSPGQDLNLLRAPIGIVFQKQTPFPVSIFENIDFGIHLYEKLPRLELESQVERSLRRATCVAGGVRYDQQGALGVARPAHAGLRHQSASMAGSEE
jgi:ABC-type phosphate transport system ATPase subunit